MNEPTLSVGREPLPENRSRIFISGVEAALLRRRRNALRAEGAYLL